MTQLFKNAFAKYPAAKAPFLHQQYHNWNHTKPLRGLRVLHHVPVVQNTLLKIAALIAAGAEVVVTNPDCVTPCQKTIAMLQQEGISYVSDLSTLIGSQPFDLYFDCGAELYTVLGAPQVGAIELTGTGDTLYRQLSLQCPVISVDRTLTKQLETVFGMAASAALAITQLTGTSIANKSWLVFGFGKIGRGLAYACVKNNSPITIVDTNPVARAAAQQLNINAIDAHDLFAVETAARAADIVITATGGANILRNYDTTGFKNKILANAGVLDEFGSRFTDDEVLNNKKALNFVLEDPTPIEYVDPELYAHNQVALDLLNNALSHTVHDMSPSLDAEIIARWCELYSQKRSEIERWFVQF